MTAECITSRIGARPPSGNGAPAGEHPIGDAVGPGGAPPRPIRRHAPYVRGSRGAYAAVLVILTSAAPGFAGEATPDQGGRAYARAVAEAQSYLDRGQAPAARERLGATDVAARGFEYHYLLARAEAAPMDGDGKAAAAPDLVRTIPMPDVEARYGVLDEVGRQMVFVCRDGTLRVHDLDDPDAPAKVAAREGGGGAAWSGAFSRDGKTFVAGHENGDVVVWDAGTWRARHTVPLAAGSPVRELAVAPDGSAFGQRTPLTPRGRPVDRRFGHLKMAPHVLTAREETAGRRGLAARGSHIPHRSLPRGARDQARRAPAGRAA